MTSRHPLPAILLLLAVAAGAAAPAAEAAEPAVADAALERFLVEALHTPANAGASVALSALGGTIAKLMAASDAGIEVRVGEGGNLALPWSRVSEADLFAGCHPFIAKAGAPVQAHFLAAAIRLGHGHERDIQDLLAAVRAVDAASAHELETQLEGQPVASKERVKEPGKDAAKPSANSTADAPTTAPAAAPASEGGDGEAGGAAPEVPHGERERLAAALGALVGKDGKLNKAAYLRALSGNAHTIDQWLGPDWAYYHSPDSHAPAAKASAKSGLDKDGFPTLYLAPSRMFKKGHNGAGATYQIGDEPSDKAGDYSSTQGQVLYVPDKPNDPGCDRVMILEEGNDIFTESPETPWWGGGHPEPALAKPGWAEACGGHLGVPLNVNRTCAEWDNCGLIVFNSGLIGAAGTCTAGSCSPCLMLPRGKVPTAVSITNKNEFALVTVWDTETCKGQLAVIALGSVQAPGSGGTTLFCEWKESHPCLPNSGAYGFMKLIGFVDLGIAAPSDVIAVGNRLSEWIHINGKNSQSKECDFSQQGMRDSFYSGENKNIASNAGFAVVISRAENKAVFVDLAPLFLYAREMYFTGADNYAKTTKIGPGAKEWPYTFETEPRWRPHVVRTIEVPHPTAVSATLGGPNMHAYIATLDGTLRIYKVGALAGASANGDIVECGEVKVGRNPTCIAYAKSHWNEKDPHANSLLSEMLVVSRGDREIEWVEIHGDSGEVYRRLRDSRLLDPVHVEVADNHGTCSYILSVTDFKGRKLLNYRWGPVIFHTNTRKSFGVGADGMAEFECAGIMELPGYPYRVCASNVN
jgi:hypothetical protein